MTTYDGFDTLPIAGQWRVGRDGRTADDVNPYSGDVLTTLPLADAADVDAAFTAASIAQRDWESTLPTERADVFHRAARIMEERKDEIVDWLVAEVGAIRPRAEWEWLAVRAVMLESASYPTRSAGRILPAALIDGKENRVYRRPLGVVTVISPWNFPMQLSARSVAPALALGNAVVLKPASDTPVTGGLLLARILEDAGLPAGLLSVVVGKSSEIGDAVTSHPLTRLVSFTGSTPVGSGIAASAPLTRMSLELGGNGPLVVLEDADVEAAVNAAVFGSFFHQGQVCMATNRVIAVDAVHDEVVDRLTERVRSLRTGDPADPDTQIGPIINDAQVESTLDRISRPDLSRGVGRRGDPRARRAFGTGRAGAGPTSRAGNERRRDRRRGGVRTRRHGDPRRRGGRRRPDRERHRVRALQRGVLARRRACGPGGDETRRRNDTRERHHDQRRAQHRVRRREELGHRSFRRRVGHRGVHHRPLDQRPAHAATVCDLTSREEPRTHDRAGRP
ncbi:acyl-CoA reductase-like NAD-dependent aldehyde dehydrogenase [Rhodococcus sp. SORGH_AS 301]|nr:aldehyde dehydrogenase family protein [Rhodococcus sp. SORGH_AS_0301]MDQ1181498.1 acyl-CoA reductase-like NAD-dependent aldehyde dehydrogenase [Rhodococcus sp. SORGH_AS_0301]